MTKIKTVDDLINYLLEEKKKNQNFGKYSLSATADDQKGNLSTFDVIGIEGADFNLIW